MSDDLLLLCRSYKLIIAYHVYYDYYKIDRNKQSKIAVHETDILNSHFTEHFYRQSRLTAVEQITFHDTKIKHFTFHATLPEIWDKMATDMRTLTKYGDLILL